MRKSVLAAIAVFSLLSACQTSTKDKSQISKSLNLVDASALSAFFVESFAPFEAAAANLRNNNPRYTIQQNTWSFVGDSESYDSYSLSNANVEYAHAAGLTGEGQLIAIVDAGFLLTHDEFAEPGKITLPGGVNNPGIDNHGTAVASIAAGAAELGEIIGVAPGASLYLGSFDTLAKATAATIGANSLGAIVQNNSWGYDVDATNDNYDLVFDSADGRDYINALKDFAKNGVIVFAASNDSSRTRSDLMAALPTMVDEVKRSWITAINAVPNFSGGQLQSASLISSGCLDAAAWCMAADGTVIAANATGDSDYDFVTGSSFSAPQISGAVALLAEAFPTLNAEELRARLLASANNKFYKSTGYVEFAPGIKHGYNDEFGHGFLDLKAALLPIGSSFIRSESGRKISVDKPVVLSGGMVGDALTTRLAKFNLVFEDGLGGGFSAPANILTANKLKLQDVRKSLGTLMATDLGARGDPFRTQRTFATFVAGQEMDFDIASTNFAVLMPSNDRDEVSYGFAFRQHFDLGTSALSLGFNAMREGDGFVGMKSLLDGERLGSTHGAATVEWTVPLVSRQEVRLSGSLGIAVPDGDMSTMSLSAVRYNSIGASYAARDVFGDGDRFSFGVSLPHVINSGSADFTLPVSRGYGKTSYQSVKVPLAPSGRQMDLSISYGLPLSDHSEVIMSAVHSLNSGNIAGFSESVAALGWRFRF